MPSYRAAESMRSWRASPPVLDGILPSIDLTLMESEDVKEYVSRYRSSSSLIDNTELVPGYHDDALLVHL
jgi:hypothetical protein